MKVLHAIMIYAKYIFDWKLVFNFKILILKTSFPAMYKIY